MHIAIIGSPGIGMFLLIAHEAPTPLIIPDHQEEKEREWPPHYEQVLAIREHDLIEEFFYPQKLEHYRDYKLRERYTNSLAHTTLKSKRIIHQPKRKVITYRSAY